MSSKMLDIQRALSQASGQTARAPVAAEASPTGSTLEQVAARKTVPPSREGKVHIGAYLDPGFKRSLRMVQAATDETIEELISKALNELFRAHNVPVVGQD